MKTFFWAVIFSCSLFSQESNDIHSLRKRIDTVQDQKIKVGLFTDLAWEYINQESDSAIYFSEAAKKLASSLSYPLGEAISLETKGLYYEIVKGNYEEASKLYFKAIKICDENELTYSSSIYHTLGVMFHTSDNYEKALEYYQIAYDSAVKNSDLVLQKKCLANMASINSSLHKYDTAEELFVQSLMLEVRNEMNYDIYANLGNLYIRKKEYDKAIPFLEKATLQTPENTESEGNLRFLIDAKTALKDSTGMKLIIERAKKALESSSSLRERSIMTMSISNYYRQFKDFENALKYRDEYLKLYEDIKEKQRDETVYELEAKYQTERTKEALEKEKKQQKIYLVLFIIGLILSGLLAILFYKNWSKKTQLSNQKKLLEATLDEKNILLKEIHHRVKNSFQIVSSLLYLQSENLKDSQAKLAIKEAENRVRSMVLIHQKLYNRDELVGINTKEYFGDLVKDIFQSHQLKSESIDYQLNIEPYILDIETITPLGLILNELIINTLKHAFEGIDEKGKLNVNFDKEKDCLVLKVKDNGKGFEGEVKNTSFGIKLMKALSKKLKANLEYHSNTNKGTEVILTIHKFNIIS